MAHKFTTSYVEESTDVTRHYKTLAERALAQVTDEELYRTLDGEMNSIATVMVHLAGNLRSRWTDFLTSDGEKPDRNRDGEFVNPPATREALMQVWEDGWSRVLTTMESLTDADLGRTVTIRGEAHSVMQAINRQVTHSAHHVGQIVMLAKHFAHDHWQSLSIPRHQSEAFNRRMTAEK
jgi:hypothetical protein